MPDRSRHAARERPEYETTPDEEPSERPPRADEVIAVVAEQVLALEALTLKLEAALAESICSCVTISEEAIHNLQRLDYLRQSLSDSASLLATVGDKATWRNGEAPSAQQLRQAVNMRESLGNLFDTTETTPEDGDDAWL